ncbi:MAG: spore germination protein [Negativicutes bacterium]|nr:spore germination protein [Negativicutes bacterium]
MHQGKTLNFHKLSTAIPSAALAATNERLKALRQLTSEGAKIGRDISRLAADLRKVAAPQQEPFIFTSDLETNERLLRSILRDCEDVIYRTLALKGGRALLVYVHGMTDEAGLAKFVIQPLLECSVTIPEPGADIESYIQQHIYAAGIQFIEQPSSIIGEMMGGRTLLLFDGHARVALIGTTQFAKRNVGDSKTEGVVRGPHEAFNETLIDNIALLRRRVRDPNLKIKILNVGDRSGTRAALAYVSNLVKPGLLEEVEKRIAAVSTDIVLTSFKIEELISKHPWSPFPQAEVAERPDTLLNALYGGRVGIMVDGTPLALVVPATFLSMMQATDDYTTQPLGGMLIRMIRYLSSFLAVYLPALYISVVSFHPGMLPTTLAISIAELRSRTPFPSILEAFGMIIILEIFQEAIIRLPQRMVTAASVVGGFVIGTTVVEAGLINPLLVVVVAMTAIASYTASFDFAVGFRVVRIFTLLAASVLGLYGTLLALLFTTVHLCALRSFGESVLGGLFDITLLEDWKDGIVRVPLKLNRTRPKVYGPQDRTRAGDDGG